VFRRSYRDDPERFGRIRPLLGAVFTGLPAVETEARRRGLRREEVSVPFLRLSGGRPVAHVGLLELPLHVDGETVTVGGIHAVCTLPDHRRRGFARELLAEAIEYGLDRYGTLTLTTEDPWIYEPHGFRIVDESRFVTDAPPSRPGRRPHVRRFDGRSAADVAMLRALLMERASVSRHFGVVGEEAIFLFNTALTPLDVAEDLGAVISAARDGGTLALYDVVAREMPTLAEILARYDPVERVEVYFAPDRLDGNDHLMVLGPFPPESTPFMLPRTVRS
jgi:GNAT superfamily N-acetyltransferase